MSANAKKGEISVKEAGRRGGQSTVERHGREFYHQIGVKGGNRVRELIKRGKRLSERDKKRRLINETYQAMEEAENSTIEQQ